MAFEPSYEKVVSSFRKKLGTTQAVIECRLPANEGKVATILCANAKSYIVGSEVVGNEISFNGFVGFQTIYQDSEGYAQGLDYTAEFRDRFTLSSEDKVVTPIVTSNVVDIKSTAQDTEIKIVAIIEINIEGIIGGETTVLVSLNDDRSFMKSEMMDYMSFDGTVTDRFELTQEVEIKDSISRVLSVCPSIYIEKVVPNERGFVTVKGGVNLDITYVGDNGIIRTHESDFDFSQEVSHDKINDLSVIQSMIDIVINDIKITTSLDVDRAIISIVMPTRYTGFIFNNKQIEVVTDVFNCDNYLNLNFQSIDIQTSYPSIEYDERITGNATIDENMPFMDEILGNCCNSVILANSRIEDGRLLLEGIAYTTIIYFNKEENKMISYEVEMPFSLLLNANDIPSNYTPIVSVSLGDVVAKSKRGKEIDINAKLFVFAEFYALTNDAVISSVTVADSKIVDDLVLTIYIVKDGETIWDIAKELNVSPELILEQNPELTLPLKAGDRIIIYKQRVIEF